MMTTPIGLGAIYDLVNDVRLSGRALADEIQRRAGILASLSFPPASRIVIAHGNSPAFFADLFAVWQAGGCAVCVNPRLTDGELSNVVAFVQAAAVLVGRGEAVDGHGARVLCLAEEGRRGHAAPRACLSPDDPALILFTSGTTGEPKGVVHTRRSLSARIALNLAYISRSNLSSSLCVLPTHFGHGLIGNCLTPLAAGGELFLFHGAGTAGAAALDRIIDEHAIGFMSSVPSFWKLALRLAAPPRTRLDRVHIGSAPLSGALWRDVIEWAGTDCVVNTYGITETANWIGGASARHFAPEDGLVGKPWGGCVVLLDEDGTVLSQGSGEIAVQTPAIMAGYFRRDDLTKDVMTRGFYRTGDIGEIDEAGIVRLTGRQRYCINRGGFKIYPEELDLLLESHPDITEACAFGIADAVAGEMVGAAIRPRDGVGLNPQAVHQWIARRIRSEACPDRLFILDAIPKTDRGKLNRDRVAAACMASEKANAAQPPRERVA